MAKKLLRLTRLSGAIGSLMLLAGCGGDMVFVGILAAVAVPAYQDFTIRAQVNSGIVDSAVARMTVAESYADTGNFEQAAYLDFQSPESGYVDNILVEQGNVIVVYGGRASGQIQEARLVFSPYVQGDSTEIVWVCGYAQVPEGMTPIGSMEETAIDPKFLPSTCK